MRTLGILVALLIGSFNTMAQAPNGKTIRVTVENVMNDQGNVLASLHTAETFMKGAGIATVEVMAKQGAVTLTFENVVPGTYAIMVLHDENANRRMDFDTNGMPLENYGMPGNQMAIGPPSFEDAKFEMSTANQEFRIRF